MAASERAGVAADVLLSAVIQKSWQVRTINTAFAILAQGGSVVLIHHSMNPDNMRKAFSALLERFPPPVSAPEQEPHPG